MKRLTFGRLQVYIEPRDIWVGVYVAENAVYVLPLPLCVFRWQRQEKPPPCEWFAWIGQPYGSCDRCGRPAWDHKGEETFPRGPFDDRPPECIPWRPGEAEMIRHRWESR